MNHPNYLYNVLPEDALKKIVSYIPPCDVFNLCRAYPDDIQKDKGLLLWSLECSLNLALKSSSTKFKSSDPLQSFCNMTDYSPRGSIVLRYVLARFMLCFYIGHPFSLYYTQNTYL